MLSPSVMANGSKKLSFLVHPDLNAGISPPGDLRSQLHGERARSGQNDPILNLFDSILIVVATADAAMSPHASPDTGRRPAKYAAPTQIFTADANGRFERSPDAAHRPHARSRSLGRIFLHNRTHVRFRKFPIWIFLSIHLGKAPPPRTIELRIRGFEAS